MIEVKNSRLQTAILRFRASVKKILGVSLFPAKSVTTTTDVKTEERLVELPMELIIDILSRLSVKSLLRFKCVSKFWCNLIGSRDFIKLHLNKSKESNADIYFIVGCSYLCSLDINSSHGHASELYCPEFFKDPVAHGSSYRKLNVELMGSSNGLVCFYEAKNGCFSLYNPATRAYNQLPKLTSNNLRVMNIFCRFSSAYFAYDCVADDYKVLDITGYIEEGNTNYVMEGQVYSLKTNSWKVLSTPMLDDIRIRSGVINNFVHFIISPPQGSPFIMRLDVVTQRSDTMSLPKNIIGRVSCVTMLRGYLHVITDVFDMWVMKEYGVEESWIRLFYDSLVPRQVWGPEILWALPIAYSKDGHKIMVEHQLYPKIFSCDLDSQIMDEIQLARLPQDSFERIYPVPWVESLVLPFQPT